MSVLFSLDFWAFVGITAGIYTIFGLGIQLQFGFGGLLNFGHVAFMAIGGYAMALLVIRAGLSLWVAIPLALVATLPFSLLLGLPTLRLRSDYLAITTLAFSEIVRFVAVNEEWLTGGSQGTINLARAGEPSNYNPEWLALIDRIEAWLAVPFGEGASRNLSMMLVVWLLAIALLVLMQYLVRSPWGRVLRSIREDEDAAATLGKDVFLYKQQALAIGSMLGALAGMLHALQFSFFSPADFVPLITFFAWMVVILGGTARNWGVPVGALTFAILFAGTRFFSFPPFDLLASDQRAYVRMIIIGLLLIGLMLFRPQGAFGRRQEMVLE